MIDYFLKFPLGKKLCGMGIDYLTHYVVEGMETDTRTSTQLMRLYVDMNSMEGNLT